MSLRSRSSRRRTNGEIVIDILRALHEKPLGPTNLVFTANLNWYVLKTKFLPPLLVLKLVISKETEGDERTKQSYQLTQKGETILSACKKYKVIAFALEELLMGTPNQRRTRMDLVIDILLAAKERKGITRIMDDTRMSFRAVSRCAEALCKGDLLMMLGKKGEHPYYQTTGAGNALIETYRNGILYVIKIIRDKSLDVPFDRIRI